MDGQRTIGDRQTTFRVPWHAGSTIDGNPSVAYAPGSAGQPARWRLALTAIACLVGGGAFVAALAIEWYTAPEWISPRKVFGGFAHLWNPWYPIVLAESLPIAVLVWFKRGRLLLGSTACQAVVVVACTLVRGQTVLAYLVLAALSVLAGGVGRRLCRWLAPNLPGTALERLLFALVAGYGSLGVVGLALAAAHGLQFATVAGALVLLALLVRTDCQALLGEVLAAGRLAWANARQTDLRLPAVAVAAIALCALSALMVALSWDVEYDAMVYHLGIPQQYLLAGGLVDVPECLQAHFCHNVEMLYTLGLVLVGQPLPQLLHGLAGVLAAALLYCLGRRIAGARVGWLAAAIFCALPLVSQQLGHAMADLFTTLYLLAALQAAVLWLDGGGSASLRHVGGFAGLALGAKLNALLFVVPLEALVLGRIVALGRLPRRAGEGNPLRAHDTRLLKSAVTLGLLTLAAWAPWLALEWQQTGNPIFPFFQTLFTGPLNEMQELFAPTTVRIRHGLGDLLRLPWDLAAWPGQFGHFFVDLEGLTLACLPVTALLWPRRWWRLLWLPAAVLGGGTLLWFFQFQCLRYLLPVVPVMTLLAALNAEALWLTLATTPRRQAVLAGVALAAGLCWLQGASWWVAKRHSTDGFPWRVALGLQAPEEHLRWVLPEYDPLRYLAAEAEHRPTRVLTYPRHFRLYGGACAFYGRICVEWNTNVLLGRHCVPAADAIGLARAMAELPIDYLLVSYDREYQAEPPYDGPLLEAEFLQRHCQLVMTRDGFYHRRVCLYRFIPETVGGRLNDE